MRKMSRKVILIWLLISLFSFHCHKKNPVTHSVQVSYTTDGRPALVLVMENNNWLGGGTLETGFQIYKTEVLEIL